MSWRWFFWCDGLNRTFNFLAGRGVDAPLPRRDAVLFFDEGSVTLSQENLFRVCAAVDLGLFEESDVPRLLKEAPKLLDPYERKNDRPLTKGFFAGNRFVDSSTVSDDISLKDIFDILGVTEVTWL